LAAIIRRKGKGRWGLKEGIQKKNCFEITGQNQKRTTKRRQRKNIQTFLFSWQHGAKNSDWILYDSTIPLRHTYISCSRDYTCPIGRWLFFCL